MTSKSKLHRLVDELPEAEIGAAERFLQYLRSLGDPVLRAVLEAPESDVGETADEAAAVQEGREAYGRGEFVADDQLKALTREPDSPGPPPIQHAARPDDHTRTRRRIPVTSEVLRRGGPTVPTPTAPQERSRSFIGELLKSALLSLFS